MFSSLELPPHLLLRVVVAAQQGDQKTPPVHRQTVLQAFDKVHLIHLEFLKDAGQPVEFVFPTRFPGAFPHDLHQPLDGGIQPAGGDRRRQDHAGRHSREAQQEHHLQRLDPLVELLDVRDHDKFQPSLSDSR